MRYTDRMHWLRASASLLAIGLTGQAADLEVNNAKVQGEVTIWDTNGPAADWAAYKMWNHYDGAQINGYHDLGAWGGWWRFRVSSPNGMNDRVMISGGAHTGVVVYDTNNVAGAYVSGTHDSYFTRNVGVGTTTPSAALDVNGTAKVNQLTVTAGANEGYLLRSDASGNAAWAPASSLIAMPGAMLNLLITNQAADVNNKVGITAEALALSDTNGTPLLLRNVSLTVDIGTAGANGIDETPELSSRWYYIWVVHNGTSTAGLLSTNHLCPKEVSGYPTNSYKTLVGAVFNNSSGNFNDFLQHDRRVWISQQNVFTGKAINTASTYLALNSTDRGTFQNIVPAIARSVVGTAARASGNSANIMNLRLAPEGSSLGHAPMGFSPPAGAAGWLPYEIPIRDPLNRTFYYWVSATGETWTVAVTGYSF